MLDKSGVPNINLLHLPQRSRRFFRDLVTTIVSKSVSRLFFIFKNTFSLQIDAQWRFVISFHLIALFSCWIIFAILWYLIAYAHGDIDFDIEKGILLNDEPNPCLKGASTVAGFLLFSVELQVCEIF